jgi:translation initiation factor IF-1
LLTLKSVCRIIRLLTLLLSVSKDVIELIGIVVEAYPNATFKVRVTSDQAKDHELLCHLAGRMRVHRVRILPGDKVRIEMTPYDLQKGRIVYRFLAGQPTSAPSPTQSAPGTLTPPKP